MSFSVSEAEAQVARRMKDESDRVESELKNAVAALQHQVSGLEVREGRALTVLA